MVSNISYTVSSTFHRQRFRCHVSQNGETTVYDLDEVYVEYKPTVVNLTINKEVNENEALDTPNCQANSYPAAKINYQVSVHCKIFSHKIIFRKNDIKITHIFRYLAMVVSRGSISIQKRPFHWTKPIIWFVVWHKIAEGQPHQIR